jgi:cytochrome c-type biogenesis protein CcmE
VKVPFGENSRQKFQSLTSKTFFMTNPKRAKVLAGSLILIGAFGFLVAGGMKSNTLRAMPVGELMAETGEAPIGQRLRVVGFVGREPVRRVADNSAQNGGGKGSTQYFVVHDEDKKITVEYRDALPETFKAGLPVQVDGVYYASGKMRADRVLTKCPSKYQAEEVEKATSERAGENRADKNIENQAKSQKSPSAARLSPVESTPKATAAALPASNL